MEGVRLEKDGQGYVLSIILLSGFNDPEVHEEFRALAREISHAFRAKSTRVDLCDTWWRPKTKLYGDRTP